MAGRRRELQECFRAQEPREQANFHKISLAAESYREMPLGDIAC